MSRLSIAGLVSVVSLAAVVIVVTRPGDDAARAAEWVIPDCGPTEAPVDCRFGGPFTIGTDAGSVWRGCVVGPAIHAVGTQCIAAQASITAGHRLQKRGGQVVEVDSRDASVPDRTRDAGTRDAGADAGRER